MEPEREKALERELRRCREERAALTRTLALRINESTEREFYYQRLEEYLTLRLEGELSPAELARRLAETDELSRLLKQRLLELERELERRFQAKSEILEREHAKRLGELRERELLLKQELSQRRESA
ncbi:MAG: hypothetical protein KGO96_10905 [Elusimicrobia bacterium]|nr:hypothetical protein [Elusimicrobiota bacterium]MDE2237821.1 hypothetical protein [Elusimicrobiota bacterium]MDE2426401.1 hypothetical protein [Elusimicrobiota bacterium]